MNITHLSAGDGLGGAGRACVRLHRALQLKGVGSRMLVQDKQSADPTVERLEPFADTETVRQAELIQRRFVAQNRTKISNTHFSISLLGWDLGSHPAIEEADVIHLHWVASMLTPATLNRLLSLNKPLVWTLHDQAPFTGGCHFSAGCAEFTRSCSPCPQLRLDPFGLPAAVLRDKQDLLNARNLSVVAPSAWLADQAEKSAVFRSCPRIAVIPYGIDPELFRPELRADARAALGIPREGTYVLCGADHGDEKRKGLESLKGIVGEALRDPRFLRAEVRVLSVGPTPAALESSDLPLIALGRIESEERMALAYAAADLFVLPSREDNVPNMLLEALACATPVAAYSVGGIPEVVRDGVNGRLVPAGNETLMTEALVSLVADPAMRRRLGESGRSQICRDYAASDQASRYLALYASLIDPAAGTGERRRAPKAAPYPPADTLRADPGPAVVSLLDRVTAHCLTEELRALEHEKHGVEIRLRTAEEAATARLRIIDELREHLHRAEEAASARLRIIDDLQDHLQRAEAECAARLHVIEELDARRARLEDAVARYPRRLKRRPPPSTLR